MYLANLQLARFRNITDADLFLRPGINLLHGDNGAGKTALLESVHLLSRGRSFRASQNAQLIQREQEDLVVRGQVKAGETQQLLARRKGISGLNQARINGDNASRQSKFAEILPLQALLPGVSDLVLDGPGIRREFLDWGLFHVEQQYLPAVKRFRRGLSQRAAWLKEAPAHGFQGDPWVAAMAAAGVEISQWRQQFIELINEQLTETLKSLSVEFNCQLAYTGESFAEGEAQALSLLERSFDRDRRMGATQVGPHRSDMTILIDGVPARSVVSRGQAKLIASALVLSYAAVLEAKKGAYPILLLDDLGAELDQFHRQLFFRRLVEMGCQVIATTAEDPQQLVSDPVLQSATVFHVEHGVFTQK